MICHSKSLDVNELIKKVGEETILTHYFNVTQIPCVINSPLRKDKHPSFAILYTKSQRIMYKDFATGESGGLFDLLQRYFNDTFENTLLRVYEDLKYNIVSQNKVQKLDKFTILPSIKIKVKTREWLPYDLEWWEQYGINQKWLEFGQIYPITDIFLIKNKNTNIVPAEKYAYAFLEFKDEIQTIKIYQPESKRYKWLCTHDDSVWDLWQQLPKNGNHLIITSSRKDALCLWANLGIPSCCLQSEQMQPKEKVIKELQNRFKNIYIIYDNDYNKLYNTGQKHAINLASMYHLKNICIDSKYGVKDPSDLFKQIGKQEFINIFKQYLCG